MTPPEVWIEAPFRSDDVHIPVTWGAGDGQSGVAYYDLDVSEDGGPWQRVLTRTTATSDVQTCKLADFCSFRVTATDHVGNSAHAEARTHLVRVSKYYYHGGTRVAMREIRPDSGNMLYYLHGDHLGSTSLVTLGEARPVGGGVVAPAGSVWARRRYDPYGETRYTYGRSPTDFGFTDQREDSGTGLMYYRARYYHPALGRFVSADAIVPNPQNPVDFNRYAYTRNNPVIYTDPTGHVAWVPLLMAGGAIGGAILTTVTYVATTDNFELDEFGMALGAGALGGALIGSGVGAVAGGAMIAGVLVGAGVGTIAAAEGYMLTTDDFDKIDFAIDTTFGTIEGAACAGASPLGAGVISAVSSGARSAVSDVAHGESVDWDKATSDALWGGVTGFAAAGIADGITKLVMPSSPGISIGQGPPVISWIPPESIADRLIAQAEQKAFRNALRSVGAETAYYIGSDKVYEMLR